MDKLDKLTDFHKLCIENCVRHKLAVNYRSTHKNLTDEQVIEQCRYNAGHSKDKVFTLEDYCKAAEVDIEQVLEFKDDIYHDLYDKDPETLLKMTNCDWVLGYLNTQRCDSIVSICDILNSQGIDCSVPRFKALQRKNPDWTTEDIIAYIMMNPSSDSNKIYYIEVDGQKITLSSLCNKLSLNYNAVRRNIIVDGDVDIYKLVNLSEGKLSINIFGKLITLVETEETKVAKESLAELCRNNNVNYKSVITYKKRYNISDELAIKMLAHPEKLTKKDHCDIAGVNNKKVYHYMEHHPGVTLKQAIKAVKNMK